jgi:membrane protease YdiL (CAAX protease family)
VLGILIPALLPFPVFLFNLRVVSAGFLWAIVLFAAVNPYFEETFWRGLMDLLPVGPRLRVCCSGILFSFSHFILWGAYWLSKPRILVPTLITTFFMGLCWMWLYQRTRTLLYPILSHALVDVFNLSVAVFCGVRLLTA